MRGQHRDQCLTAVAAPRRVDPMWAAQVASAFLDGDSTRDDGRVRAAYRALGEQAGHWFSVLTDEHMPWAVRVHFTRCAEPYASAQELSESVRLQRTLEVTAARYDRGRRHPALGGAYDRLRAVHDVVSHGWLRYSFDRDGEYSAWCTEHTMYRGIARWALATELHAEHSVLWTSGALAEHKAVLLGPRLLARSLGADRIAAAISPRVRVGAAR